MVALGVLAGCSAARPLPSPAPRAEQATTTATATPIVTATASATPSATPTEPAPAAANETVDAEIARLLAEDRVDPARWARRELYTWTTDEQLVGLRAQPFLLTRTESPSNGPALFDQRMREAAAGPVGKLLRGKALAFRRFAWVAPWATHAGWENERYGDVLIRIVLKDEAIVARYDTRAAERWSFQDVIGGAVSEAEVLAHPERLAAVFHVWYGGDEGAAERQLHAFREYVVCNESMIASWEVGTVTTRDRLLRDRNLVAALDDALRRLNVVSPSTSAEWQARVIAAWTGAPDGDVVRRYEAALAFVNPLYLFSAANLNAQDKALDALRVDLRAPLVVQPKLAFGQTPPNAVLVTAPVRRGRCMGTFCG